MKRKNTSSGVARWWGTVQSVELGCLGAKIKYSITMRDTGTDKHLLKITVRLEEVSGVKWSISFSSTVEHAIFLHSEYTKRIRSLSVLPYYMVKNTEVVMQILCGKAPEDARY